MNSTRSRFTRSLSAALAIAILSAHVPAQARVGGGTGGSKGGAVAASRSYTPAPSPQRAGGGDSSGMSRGNTLAQARAEKQAKQAQQQGYAQPNYAQQNYNRNYGQPAPAYVPAQPYRKEEPRKGFTGTQMAGAAAAAAVVGGVTGYMMGKSDTPQAPAMQPTAPAVQGAAMVQPTVASGLGSAQQPAAIQPMVAGMSNVPEQSSGGSGLLWLLLGGLLLGGVAFAMMRASKASSSVKPSTGYGSLSSTPKTEPTGYVAPTSTTNSASAPGRGKLAVNQEKTEPTGSLFNSFNSSPAVAASSFGTSPVNRYTAEAELLNMAPTFFRDLQTVNNNADKQELARMAEGSMLSEMLYDIDTRTTPSQTRVLSVNVLGNCVRDFVDEGNRYVASIYFESVIAEGNGPSEQVDELWNFVREVPHGQWKLAGIEQV